MGFKENVLRLLKEKGLKQSDLAKMINKPRQNVSTLLKNDSPSMATIGEFARALSVTPADLLMENTFAVDEEKLANAIISDRFELLKNEDGTEIRDLGEGRTLLVTPLISREGNVAYTQGREDEKFLMNLPKHAVSMDSISLGVHRSFEMNENLYDEDHVPRSLIIPSGSILTGKLVHELSPRFIEENGIYILVSGEGISMVRPVNYHAVRRMLEYRTLLSDSIRQEVDLNSISEIYRVVAITQYV